MFATKIAAIFTLAVAVSASLTARQAEIAQCGNTGKISCCNRSDTEIAAGGILTILTSTISARACSPPPLDIDVSDPSAICGGNIVYCCEDTINAETGDHNPTATCSPIDLSDLHELL